MAPGGAGRIYPLWGTFPSVGLRIYPLSVDAGPDNMTQALKIQDVSLPWGNLEFHLLFYLKRIQRLYCTDFVVVCPFEFPAYD